MKKLHYIHLLGPTCVGKGFILKLFKRSMSSFPVKMGVVSIGGRVKHLLENDAAFRQKFAASIKAGHLLPDDEVMNIFELELKQLQPGVECVLVDGFLRNIEQTRYAIDNGYLNTGDCSIVIDADNDVCLKRFLGRTSSTEGQHRIDNEIPTFQDRYKLFRRTINGIKNHIAESDAILREIDGNQDIAEFVFPHIQQAVWPQLCAILTSRPRQFA